MTPIANPWIPDSTASPPTVDQAVASHQPPARGAAADFFVLDEAAFEASMRAYELTELLAERRPANFAAYVQAVEDELEKLQGPPPAFLAEPSAGYLDALLHLAGMR